MLFRQPFWSRKENACFSNNSFYDFADHRGQGNWTIITLDSFIARLVYRNNSSSLSRFVGQVGLGVESWPSNRTNTRSPPKVPTTPACTWWIRPEEDPSSGKLESTHPSRTSVKYDQVFFGVESIMRVNAASLDIRDATTATPGTLNDLTTDLIMANNNNIASQVSSIILHDLTQECRKNI